MEMWYTGGVCLIQAVGSRNGKEEDLRVYLDNCCYNRPFDNQDQPKVMIETLAKLAIQRQMRAGEIEYAWSEVLDFEIGRSRFIDRKLQIAPWANGAALHVNLNEDIRLRAKEFEAAGVKAIDALHLACAEAAGCDWFFTTDKGILSKARPLASMRVANPVEFIGEV